MRCIALVLGLAVAAVTAVQHPDQRTNVEARRASGYWYERIKHNGINPGLPNGNNWTVFRNVKDFGAKGDGTTDDAAAIQSAINFGDSSGTRASGSQFGSTGQPAVVYFPQGTYVVGSTINNYIGTVLLGDPTNRPSIKASSNFRGSVMISGVDPRFTGLIAFYHEIKNLIFDSTAVPTNSNFTLIDWPVSQACQLSNSVFNMAKGAAQHTGIRALGSGSPLLLNDLQFNGGGIGYIGTSTQYHLKNIYFKGITTGIKTAGIVQITGQGLKFEDVTTGVDATVNGLGMLNLIDSTARSTKAVVAVDATQPTTQGSLVLENVIVDSFTVPATVKAGNSAILTGSVTAGTTWIRGNVYQGSSTPATPKKSTGQRYLTTRPLALIDTTGSYYTVTPPTYADFDVSQVINVKDVAGSPVRGDGTTDDTANLQIILNTAAKQNKIAFFPHGIYILTDTLYIPPGSRLVGESFTELSGAGDKFKDSTNPKPIIQVGKPGEVGVAQFTDFVFTVKDVLPGAIIIEVNMAGTNPGDVAVFNTHFRIGGARNTATSNCTSLETCKAVHLAAHITKSASVYWENSWAWTADHSLDGDSFGAYPTPAAGFLIEAQGGCWFLGWGVEHFVLYQVTLSSARNVFIGLQQGEAAYFQGTGNTVLPPAPWNGAGELLPTDPTFSWCGTNNETCRMSIYQRVANSTNINIYSSGFWNFVSGPNRQFCATDCQDNAVLYENNYKLYSYGVSTINNKNLILETGPGRSSFSPAVTRPANQGSVLAVFQTAVMAAYLRQNTCTFTDCIGL